MNSVIGRSLDPVAWENTVLTEEQILEWFVHYKCGWFYDGEPCAEKAHAKLRSGKCSNGYYDCRSLFEKEPRICAILGAQLAKRIKEAGLNFTWIISSSYSAIIIGHEVAKIMKVPFSFTLKDPADKKRQVWTRQVPEGNRILQVEELSTTLGTPEEVRRAVKNKNSYLTPFVPVVAMIIYRPDKLSPGRKVIALVEKETQAWEPEDCPYCKVGSVPYEPKTNWDKLIA